MAISLKPQHLKRYKDLAWLLWKYGGSDLIQTEELGVPPPEAAAKPSEPTAEELAGDLEEMGPTFIKLGQLLSTRPDLMPPKYTAALSRLQDKVEPFPFEQVEQIIATELGVRVSRAFQAIDPKPLAAASLGQVHRAVLRDGRLVAIKVQRPGIRERVVEDLDAMHQVAEFIDEHTDAGRRAQYVRILEEFRKTLLRELDYRIEAHNLTTLGRNLERFERIIVPQPVEDYTSGRVLTMEYIRGANITSLSPVARLEIDGSGLADELFAAYLQQVLVDGFFHADPHPGNVFLTQDNRIALLDLGMVATLSQSMQDALLHVLLAVSEGQSDEAVDYALRMGDKLADFDEKELRRRVSDLVTQQRHGTLKQMEVGTIVLEIRKIALECGVRLPAELSLLGKTLLNLDQIGWTLDPEFDPNAAIRRHAAELLRKRFLQSFSTGNFFGRALEAREFIQALPQRVNRILDAVANSEMRIKVDAIDETRLMAGFQKVANRITLGLILAALIIGAAMLMRVDTSFKLFGYPGLAILLFLLAAAGGIAFAMHILLHDESPGGKPR